MNATPDWVTFKIFLATAELGSITRAAQRCGIATSAAAKRIQMLEADYGVALVERTARGVKPTAAGEAFARHARTLLDFAARLADDLAAFAAGGVGSVRLHATVSVIVGHGVAEALTDFQAHYSGIQVELREATSLSILHDLTECRADVGLITSASTVPLGLHAWPWREDGLLVVMATDHPLATRASVRFDEVLDYPLIGAVEGSAISILLEERAQQLGRRPHYRFQVLSTDAARCFVAAGHGITIKPDGMARLDTAPNTCAVPLDETWARRQLRIVARPFDALPGPVRLLFDHLMRFRVSKGSDA